MVASVRTAWFVTVSTNGIPQATFLPIIWHKNTVVMHMARANRQWRALVPGSPALIIVTGPDAYISPSWYEQKSIDRRVVPTWDYTAVHLTDILISPKAGAKPIPLAAISLGPGAYLCSISTMYRVLNENQQVKDRRRLARDTARAIPELIATGPGQAPTGTLRSSPVRSRGSTSMLP